MLEQGGLHSHRAWRFSHEDLHVPTIEHHIRSVKVMLSRKEATFKQLHVGDTAVIYMIPYSKFGDQFAYEDCKLSN